MKHLRALLLISLLIVGCSNREIELSSTPPIVRLYYSPLKWIGLFASHPMLITYDGNEWHRWEIWNTKYAHGNDTLVYKDLFPLNAPVGNGTRWLETEWSGKEAARILRVLATCQADYPYANEYWFWPGPNSNTFITWIMKEAGVEFNYHWTAWGSNF